MMDNKKSTHTFFHGEAPEGWEVKKLFEIVIKPIVYGIIQAGPEVSNGIYYIKSTDVGSELDATKLSKTSFEIAYKYKRSEVIPGDIVFSLRGNIGELSIVPKGIKVANLTQGTARISVNTEKYDRLYVKYSLKSPKAQKLIAQVSKGSTFREISLEELRKIELNIPPLPEQRAIAACLGAWDEAIKKNNLLIAQKELRKKWLMQQLLTGKTRLKGFEGEWREVSYEKLLKVVKRPVEWNDAHLYNLISVRRRSGGIFLREALYGHQIKVKDLRTANEGDFLFSKMQILHGASALVTKEFAGAKISGSYIAVVARDPQILNMDFFNWYSQLPYFYHQTYISSYGVHIEKMTFDFDAFLALEMKIPSIEEQIAITRILQKADQEIELLKAKVEKIKEQKKGLMQVLLTGKVRMVGGGGRRE